MIKLEGNKIDSAIRYLKKQNILHNSGIIYDKQSNKSEYIAKVSKEYHRAINIVTNSKIKDELETFSETETLTFTKGLKTNLLTVHPSIGVNNFLTGITEAFALNYKFNKEEASIFRDKLYKFLLLGKRERAKIEERLGYLQKFWKNTDNMEEEVIAIVSNPNLQKYEARYEYDIVIHNSKFLTLADMCSMFEMERRFFNGSKREEKIYDKIIEILKPFKENNVLRKSLCNTGKTAETAEDMINRKSIIYLKHRNIPESVIKVFSYILISNIYNISNLKELKQTFIYIDDFIKIRPEYKIIHGFTYNTFSESPIEYYKYEEKERLGITSDIYYRLFYAERDRLTTYIGIEKGNSDLECGIFTHIPLTIADDRIIINKHEITSIM